MPLNLQHQTAAQFVARFREAYRTSNKERAAKLAAWLYDRVQAGDITAAQVRTAFGFNAAQFTAFQSRILALRDHYVAVQQAVGE